MAGEWDYNRKVRDRRPGNDVIDGGPGSDWLFTSQHPKVTVDLQKGFATGKGIGRETLRAVENAEGSNDEDRLIGNGRRNRLIGGHGRDFIQGRAGHDVLAGTYRADEVRGGSGRDLMLPGLDDGDLAVGGPGTDTLAVGPTRSSEDRRCPSNPQDGWAIDVADGSAARSDVAFTFDGIEDVIGSDANDTIAGDGDDNRLVGGCGDDRLNGRDGDDVLVGGHGTDACVNGEEQEGCET